VAQLAGLPGLQLEGLFTHFAKADEADKTSARAQYARYAAFVQLLEQAGVTIPIRHVCNSAALMEFDQPYDMVRFGVSLYGLYPSEEVDKRHLDLQPAMCWKTHIVHLKTVPAGTGISYGHTFVAQRSTRVATLPVGYADGYPRALSNQGRVIIRGQYAPILGRVCMDQCMVDVTEIPGAALEDEVLLLGRQGGCAVTMEELGAMSASFNYETACRVGQRVPRVYVRQGQVTAMHSVFPTMQQYLQK
jgi:alanine racemase